MSCSSPTGPVNIIPTERTCLKKCQFRYNFKKTPIGVSVKQTYISIMPKAISGDPEIIYRSTASTDCPSSAGPNNYAIKELQIYRPSIHTYGTKKTHAKAELIIKFDNQIPNSKNLIVCIPITDKNGSQPSASEAIAHIIKFLGRGGGDEEGIINGYNFNLNSFIPQQKGFYAYTASFPSKFCTKCVDYIVYDVNDAAISLDNSILLKIQNLIHETKIKVQTTHKGLGYAYNSTGAQYGLENHNTIWIDCSPTGSSGEVLIEENKETILSGNPFIMLSNLNNEKSKHILIISLIILASVLILLSLIYFVPKMLFSFSTTKPTGTQSAGTKPTGTQSAKPSRAI
jgi:hypothetical protein